MLSGIGSVSVGVSVGEAERFWKKSSTSETAKEIRPNAFYEMAQLFLSNTMTFQHQNDKEEGDIE